MKALHAQLERTSASWPTATTAKVDRFVRGKIAEAAQAQSRRVIAEAKVELVTRALRRFFELVFDGDDGLLYNVDPAGRLKIPTPWSRGRHTSYGLTDGDSRVLRAWLIWRLGQLPSRYKILWYDVESLRWHVNRRRFPDLVAAFAWLDEFGPTATQWEAHTRRLPRRGQNTGQGSGHE